MTQLTYNDVLHLYSCIATELEGFVIAAYDQPIDIMHIDAEKQKLEQLGNRINEPILLVMGDIEQLFIPNNFNTEAHGWMPTISNETETILSPNELIEEMTLSGASGSINPKYELYTYVGMDINNINDRLSELSKKGGINISTEGNDNEVLSASCSVDYAL